MTLALALARTTAAAILSAALWGCTLEGDQCAVGTYACACTPGGGCDPGLACMGNYCFAPSDESSGAEGGSAGDSATSASSADTASASADSATSSNDSTDPSSSGATDPCVENGGTLLASGYCFKECTLDGNSPGNDLFMDCVPLGMVCRDSFISGQYCTPSSWLGSECSSDADCDPGGVCVTRFDLDGSVAFSYCYIDCSTDPNCGNLHCVQDCPSGLTSPVGYCDDVEPPYGTICCTSYPDPC